MASRRRKRLLMALFTLLVTISITKMTIVSRSILVPFSTNSLPPDTSPCIPQRPNADFYLLQAFLDLRLTPARLSLVYDAPITDTV